MRLTWSRHGVFWRIQFEIRSTIVGGLLGSILLATLFYSFLIPDICSRALHLRSGELMGTDGFGPGIAEGGFRLDYQQEQEKEQKICLGKTHQD